MKMRIKKGLLELLWPGVIIGVVSLIVLASIWRLKPLESRRRAGGSSAGTNGGSVSSYEVDLVEKEESMVAVEFRSLPAPPPTAIELYVNFDPEVLTVTKVEVGDLWTDQNILQSKIDNNLGLVSFAMGQAFEAKLNAGVTIAKIYYKMDVGKEARFTLAPESAMARVGENKLIRLESEGVLIRKIE